MGGFFGETFLRIREGKCARGNPGPRARFVQEEIVVNSLLFKIRALMRESFERILKGRNIRRTSADFLYTGIGER